MPLTENELIVARSWVGQEVTDDALNERYERLGSLNAVIEETLRVQATELAKRPANVSLPSGLTVSTSHNITEARQRLEKFLASGGVNATSPGVTRLKRKDRR